MTKLFTFLLWFTFVVTAAALVNLLVILLDYSPGDLGSVVLMLATIALMVVTAWVAFQSRQTSIDLDADMERWKP